MKLEQYIEKLKVKMNKKTDDRFVYYKTAKRLLYKIKRKLRLDPRNLQFLTWAGSLALELNDLDLAYRMFERAARVKPSSYSLNNLAYLFLYEYDDAERAIKLLEQAIKMQPNSEYPYALLGEAYINLNLYNKAEDSLRRALGFKESLVILNNLGFVIFKQGRIEESIRYFKSALNHGDNAETILSYGIALALMGEKDEAERIAKLLALRLENFLKTGKKIIYADIGFLEIAEIYYLIENYEEANYYFNKAKAYGVGEFLSMFQYSLMKCDNHNEAECLNKEYIISKEEELEDIVTSDFYNNEEMNYFISKYNNEISEFIGIYKKITEGFKPPLEFTPRVLGGCYIYGCIIHNSLIEY